MLFYLAALQAIPTDVYEAAAIDGAEPWRTFWKITFPLLKPGHFFVAVVLGDRGAEGVRPGVHRLERHRAARTTRRSTAVLYLYRTAINDVRFGYAAAIGDRALRDHLRADADPAAALRQGGDGLMATSDRRAASRTARPLHPGAQRQGSVGATRPDLRAPARDLARSSSFRSSGRSRPRSRRCPRRADFEPAAAPPDARGRTARSLTAVRLRCATSANSFFLAGDDHAGERLPLRARRLRLRPPAVPRPRGPVHARARRR